jgi:hypothetical protein
MNDLSFPCLRDAANQHRLPCLLQPRDSIPSVGSTAISSWGGDNVDPDVVNAQPPALCDMCSPEWPETESCNVKQVAKHHRLMDRQHFGGEYWRSRGVTSSPKPFFRR